MNIEMSIVLYNGKKTCRAAFSCRDLDTAEKLPVLKGTAVDNSICSI